jgi:hypothetical protein
VNVRLAGEKNGSVAGRRLSFVVRPVKEKKGRLKIYMAFIAC